MAPNATGGPIIGGQRAQSKIKKKALSNANGSMSIEDQETKRLEMHMMDDINKQQSLEAKNLGMQNSFQNIKNQQQRHKQYQAPPRKAMENDIDLEEANARYQNIPGGGMMADQCNYCNG